MPGSDVPWTTSGQPPLGKGQRLFTGPGGVRDYRAHVVTDDRMVGIGTMSPEGTSELRYIWRGAAGTPPPKPRSKWVGEIGWLTPYTDHQNMRTGHQINLGIFRKAQEDKYTHRFQEPWTPSPNQPGCGFVKRPHTVASFHSSDVPLNANNSAQTLIGDSSSQKSFSRPASAASHVSAISVHSGGSFKLPSYHSNTSIQSAYTRPSSYHSNQSSRPTSAVSVHLNDPFKISSYHSETSSWSSSKASVSGGEFHSNQNSQPTNANSEDHSRPPSNYSNRTTSCASIHSNQQSRPTSRVSVNSGDLSRPQSNYGNYTNRSVSSKNTYVHPPSLYLSSASLGQNASSGSGMGDRPLSGLSTKSAPTYYRSSSGHDNAKRSSSSKSATTSRHGSARSVTSRRSIVPAATKIYRHSSHPSF